MTGSAVNAYKRQLKKQLSPELCSRRVCGLLLSRFDIMLGAMAGEYPHKWRKPFKLVFPRRNGSAAKAPY